MEKYLFIDMDNTIAENMTCDNIDFYKGMYLNKRPINVVINAIKELYPDAKYIIVSKTQGGFDGRLEKEIWIDEYFPEASPVIIIEYNEEKKDIIDIYLKINNINPENCLFIDDKKSELQKVKTLGVKTKYPQQIICDYEELNK